MRLDMRVPSDLQGIYVLLSMSFAVGEGEQTA